MKDWRGTEILLGSKIVWAVSHSSSISMNEGTVLEFIPHSLNWDNPNFCGWCANPNVGRRANCEGFSIWAEPIQETWGYQTETRKPKRVKLTAIGRVTVVK